MRVSADLDPRPMGECLFGASVAAGVSVVGAVLALALLMLLSGCACSHERDALLLADDAAQLAEWAEGVAAHPLTAEQLDALREKEAGLRAHAVALGAEAGE